MLKTDFGIYNIQLNFMSKNMFKSIFLNNVDYALDHQKLVVWMDSVW